MLLYSLSVVAQELGLQGSIRPEPPPPSHDQLAIASYTVERFLNEAMTGSELMKINKLDRLMAHEENESSLYRAYFPNLTFDVNAGASKSVLELNDSHRRAREKKRPGRPSYEVSVGTAQWDILSFGKQSLIHKISKISDANSSMRLRFQTLATKNEILRKIQRYQNLETQLETVKSVHDVLRSMLRLANIDENRIEKQPIDSEVDLASNYISSLTNVQAIEEEFESALIDLQELLSEKDRKFRFVNLLKSRPYLFSTNEIEKYVSQNSFEVAMAKENLKSKGFEVKLANLKRLPLPKITLSPLRFGAYSDNAVSHNVSDNGFYSSYQYSRSSFADLGIQVEFSVNIFGSSEFEKQYKVSKIEEAREQQVLAAVTKEVVYRAKRRVKRMMMLEDRKRLTELRLSRAMKRLEILSSRFIQNTSVYSGLDLKEAIAETSELANSLSGVEISMFEEMTLLQEDLGFEISLRDIVK